MGRGPVLHPSVGGGLAEHPVLEHEAGHVLAPGRGVQELLEAFVGHVPVDLDGQEKQVGPVGLHAGGQRGDPTWRRAGGPSVTGLTSVGIEAVESAYLDTLTGRIDPSVGLVLSL
jgi:hypothetical protein